MQGILRLAIFIALLGTTLPSFAIDYTWSGNGRAIQGNSCTIRRMDLRVSVNGSSVQGNFQIDGLEKHPFTATLEADSTFRAVTTDSFGIRTHITGVVSGGAVEFTSYGNCKYIGQMVAAGGSQPGPAAAAISSAVPQGRPGQWAGWIECSNAGRIEIVGTASGDKITLSGKQFEGSFRSGNDKPAVDVYFLASSARGRLVGQMTSGGLVAQGPVSTGALGTAMCSAHLAKPLQK